MSRAGVTAIVAAVAMFALTVALIIGLNFGSADQGSQRDTIVLVIGLIGPTIAALIALAKSDATHAQTLVNSGQIQRVSDSVDFLTNGGKEGLAEVVSQRVVDKQAEAQAEAQNGNQSRE